MSTDAPQIILGIDPATKTGFACQQVGCNAPPVFGSWDYSRVVTDETPNRSGHRLSAFREDLSTMVANNHVTLVAYEEAMWGTHNHETAAFHGEMRGIIKLVCAVHGIQHKGYNPGTIKKFWAGHGKAEKKGMMRACKTWLNLDVDDPDAADALAIMSLAIDELRVDRIKERVELAAGPKRKPRRTAAQKTLFGRK
jgi:Holliday junction resolvasome RuvABC endonuclease subunit